ncbi:MAG: LptF/LptG family permease [Proteobacteria bacterium]|nr:LptF/LptG family permease [Pseudomonadota bacterium]MBU1686101.1 LptF/LptG family permease [Pseudomonadota bacterium]
MPFLLSTYIASEIVVTFLGSLLIINAILFLGRLSSFMEAVFGYGINTTDFFRISIYLLPNLLLFSIPMASTIGVIIAFSRMAADNEILAFKASGIGLYRLLPPVVIFALCTAGATGLSSGLLIPYGNQSMKTIFYQLARERIDQGIQEKEFSDAIKDVVIHVDRTDNSTGAWRGVTIFDQRNKSFPVIIMAQTGTLEPHPTAGYVVLDLSRGSLHRTEDETAQTLGFDHYRLTLPIQVGTKPKATGNGKYDNNSDLTPLELLTAARYYKTAMQSGSNPELQQRARSRWKYMLIEFHRRLALPVGCLIMTLLALPLALQYRPGQRPIGLPLGLTAFFLYYIALTFSQSMAEESSLPIWLVMWTPNLIFALLTAFMIRSAAREHMMRSLETIIDHLANGLSLLKKMIRGAKS